MRRYHFHSNAVVVTHAVLEAPIQQTTNHKPKGLWYSIENSWIDWVASEQPDWLPQYTYRSEVIISPAKILVVTPEDLKIFCDLYFDKSKMVIHSDAKNTREQYFI